MTRIAPQRLLSASQAALTASALLLGGCSDGTSLDELPNVVIIVLDTVRADHLSCYGYDKLTTPHIDQLSESAVRYTRCRATGPWTLPSHASIFTGQFPYQHRARTEKDGQGGYLELPLNLQHWTLAEALGDLGYRTGAFVANAAYLREEFQLDQGFDNYVVEREPGLEKNVAAFEWLSAEEGPFFMFLNYMDAHRPYNTRPIEEPRAADFAPAGVVNSSTLLDGLYSQVMEAGLPGSPGTVKELIARYDTGIANADLAVGDVIAQLKQRGLWEQTLLIVTSDHGEFFGEHGLVEHSKDVYEEVMHVPLVCKLPGANAGRVEAELISLADLPSLVMDAMPEELDEAVRARFPRRSRKDVSLAENAYSRSKDLNAPYGARFRRARMVIYSGKFKYISSSDTKHELYDLSKDPQEQVNLIDKRPKVAAGFNARLAQYLKANPAPYDRAEAVIHDDEALKALMELGYTGEAESSGDDEEDE